MCHLLRASCRPLSAFFACPLRSGESLSPGPGRASDSDRKMREAAYVHGVDPNRCLRLHAIVRKPPPPLLQSDPALQTRQRRAQTEMRPLAEREHRAAVAAEVELLGAFEDLFIPVRRA